jgi:putative flippase GtrA
VIEKQHVIQDWIVRFARHVLTGVFAVLVHYGLMSLALRADAAPLVATSIGFIGGAIVRFLTAYFHVFAPSESVTFALPRFILALSAQWALNALMLSGLMGAGLNVWVAQVTTTILLTFVNYLVYRLWVFR